VLYTLFTEGHLSHAEQSLRWDLCTEALRLTKWLTRHPDGDTPQTHALLALMHLHMARLPARATADESPGLWPVLLAEQDRRLWDPHHIEEGMRWLERSARGDHLSRFHLEAKIAAAHCLAASFDATPWPDIVDAYALLERIAPSPMHRLGHALALAEWQGPGAGLAALEEYAPPSWLAGSYQWSAVLADLHRRAGHCEQAAQHRAVALRLAPSEALRASLRRRLEMAEDQKNQTSCA